MTKKHSIYFIKEYFNSHGYKLLSDKYIDSKNKLVIEDEKGYKYFLTYDFFNTTIKNNCLPWKVDSRNPFSVENIKNWLVKSESNCILISNKYTKSINRNLIFYCFACEKEWKTSWNDISSGKSCPNCQKSYGELKISNFLEKNKIEYFYQYRFPTCRFKQQLPFDFYLLNQNTCIEYQGQQHYFPVDFSGKGQAWAEEKYFALLKRDKIKIKYCKENNINLIIISYLDFNKINEILNEEIINNSLINIGGK